MAINNISKKIFVTGATGYVGRNLVDSLIKKGYQIYVLTRKESSIFSNQNNINVILGDITDPIPLPPGISTIYHCAGVIDQVSEMGRVNVQGTQNIVDIAIKNNCKFIYLSSAGIIGNTNEKILDENTKCHPHNAYELSKYRAEQIVVQAIARGLNAQILRPTTIFGYKENPKKHTFFQLAKSMRTGLYKNIGHGIYNIVHIDEVVKALEMLDQTDAQSGGAYILNNTITYKNMDILVKNLPPMIKKSTGRIPYFIAFIATIFLTIIYFILNKKNPLTFSRLRALTNKNIYSQDKIMKNLGFQNTLPVENYIRNVCEKYIREGLLP